MGLYCAVRGHDFKRTTPGIMRCARCSIAINVKFDPRFVAKGELSPPFRIYMLMQMVKKGKLGQKGRGGRG